MTFLQEDLMLVFLPGFKNHGYYDYSPPFCLSLCVFFYSP